MAANKVFWWDAPKGFKAVKLDVLGTCEGCAFFVETECPCPACHREIRKDKQHVIFIKRKSHVQ